MCCVPDCEKEAMAASTPSRPMIFTRPSLVPTCHVVLHRLQHESDAATYRMTFCWTTLSNLFGTPGDVLPGHIFIQPGTNMVGD